MNFDKAFEHLMKWEGGYVNDPDDLGGETKYGITKRRYPHLDIKNLTLEQAKDRYYFDFYRDLNIHLLPLHLQYIVFDACVNQGPAWSIRALQKLAGVKADGVIGPITARASEQVATSDYVAKRRDRYHYIARYRNNQKFLRGWLNRLDSVAAYQLSILNENQGPCEQCVNCGCKAFK